MTIYRTAGVWGAGKGSNLTAAEVDGNFYEFALSIDDLQDALPQPDEFASVAIAGTQITFTLVSGTVLGPIDLPVLKWRWRGEWTAFTGYAPLDVFKVAGSGLFLALLDHTSAATFDPAAVNGSSEPLYHQLIGTGSDTALDDLLDVAVTSPVNKQVLRYAAGVWVNQEELVATAKTANYTITASDNHVHFDNRGAVGDLVFTLPAAAAGLRFGFACYVPAAYLRVTAAGADNIAIGTSNSVDGGYVRSNAPFSFLVLEAHAAGQWVASSEVGTWTVDA